MKQLIKMLLNGCMALLLINATLNAATYKPNEVIDDDYQVFISKTREIDFKNAKQELIFYGDQYEFRDKLETIQKDIAAKGMNSSSATSAKEIIAPILYTISTAGAGLVILSISPFVNRLQSDVMYILIYDYTSISGEKSRVTGWFVADDFDDAEVIKTYLDNEIKGKL